MKRFIGLMSLLTLLYACTESPAPVEEEELIEEEEYDFVPGRVLVGIKAGVDMESMFALINDYEQKVLEMNSMVYWSDLPADSLEYVLDYINDKSYTNDGEFWYTTGYINAITGTLTVFPKFWDIHNKTYQADWLATVTTLKLRMAVFNDQDLSSGVMYIEVPEGEEKAFRDRFLEEDIVKWAHLDYILPDPGD